MATDQSPFDSNLGLLNTGKTRPNLEARQMAESMFYNFKYYNVLRTIE